MFYLRTLRAVSSRGRQFYTCQFSLSSISAHSFSAAAARMTTVSQSVRKDHRDLETYYDIIIKSKDTDERTRYQNQFTWELARHAISEELIVYPAFEKYLKDGTAIAGKDRDEHQVVKEKLKAFQHISESDPEFEPTLKSLMADLAQHIKEEEENDLPLLEDNLEAEETESLARQFERTKMFVPSRSHPMAPRKPPFETAVGLMAAPIDRLGDIFRRFPDEKVVANPSPQSSRF